MIGSLRPSGTVALYPSTVSGSEGFFSPPKIMYMNTEKGMSITIVARRVLSRRSFFRECFGACFHRIGSGTPVVLFDIRHVLGIERLNMFDGVAIRENSF
ncbi:MAG: hypothetical protein ACLR8Y_16175 [Alistipes indistinctus]